MKLQRSRIAALFATGAALAGAALLQAPAQALPQAPQAQQAVLATTFEDNFDGPAGQAPDSNKWRYDIGGSGWGNNERQYYTNSTRNSAKDGNGNLVITARRESGGFQCHYGTCEYTSARLLTAADVHPDLRPLRGPDQDPRHAGRLAGVLDARRPRRRLAEQRRDRHHGEHRPRAEHRVRHDARPGLLRRRRHRCGVPVTERAAVRATTSTPTASTGRRTRSPGTSTACSTSAGRRPTSAATSGSSTTRSS